MLSFSHTQPFFFSIQVLLQRKQHICIYMSFICLYGDRRGLLSLQGRLLNRKKKFVVTASSLWHCRELSRGVSCHQSRIQPERGVLTTRNSSAVVFTLFNSAQDICTTSGTVKLFTERQMLCAGNAEGELRTASSLTANDPNTG